MDVGRDSGRSMAAIIMGHQEEIRCIQRKLDAGRIESGKAGRLRFRLKFLRDVVIPRKQGSMSGVH